MVLETESLDATCAVFVPDDCVGYVVPASDRLCGSLASTHCSAKFISASAALSALTIFWSRGAADWLRTSSFTIAAVEIEKIIRKPSARTSDIPHSSASRRWRRRRRVEATDVEIRALIIPALTLKTPSCRGNP